MNCPLCIDQTLDATHHGGIEVDICPRCGGVWLDRGELERLAKRTAGDGGDGGPPSVVPRTWAPAPADDRRDPDHRDRDRDHDDDDDDDDDDDRPADHRRDRDRQERSEKKPDEPRKKKRKSKRSRFADAIGDVLEEVLDFD